MDIKSQVLKRLDSLYNFALDQETFDRVTFLGIGKKIQKIRFDKRAKDQAAKDNQLIETFLAEYTNESHKKIARVLLENQLRHLSTRQPDVGRTNINSLLMGTAARLIKQLMIFDNIIGLQPMHSPVGQVFNMQCTTSDDENGNKRMSLEIVAAAVEAYSRQLQAAHTIEAAQDMTWYKGFDITDELAHILSTEVMSEITYEIVADLVKLANKNPITQQIAERFQDIPNNINNVMQKINMAALRIADKTRRGPGNFIITSAIGASILRNVVSHHGYKFVNTPKEEIQSYQIGTILHIGNITSSEEDNARVIFAVYATIAPSTDTTNDKATFLIGYKGNNATDTGYIYSPYVPLMSTGIVVDSVTFQPLIRMMTRYGKWVKMLKKETELDVVEPIYMVHSSDYYVSVDVDTSSMVSITEK